MMPIDSNHTIGADGRNRFLDILSNYPIILTEGSTGTRVKLEFELPVDEHIKHASLIYTHPQIPRLIYSQYIESARNHDLPILISTHSRKVNHETIARSAFSGRDVIGDMCRLLHEMRDRYPDHCDKILLGALLGCKGEAYRNAEALNPADAYAFHKVQAQEYAKYDLDYLMAALMPNVGECIGMSRSLAETGLPYIISFMIERNGKLIDGTPIADAIQQIDNTVEIPPTCYVTNCVHTSVLAEALGQPWNTGRPELKRFKGIQANGSPLTPEELDNCPVLQQSDYNDMVHTMLNFHETFNMQIFGGCCGTDDRFIELLANRMSSVI